jgi:DNA anti-recombination protein RmuC
MDNASAPATKGDLQELSGQFRSELHHSAEQLRSELHDSTEQLRSEFRDSTEQLRSEFHHSFDELKENLRDTQTEFLKAFYSFAESNQKRQYQVENNVETVMSRLATLETRLLQVEKRLNLPPAA